MKSITITCLSLFFLIISFLLYGLRSVPLVPYISEVEANQEDFSIIKNSLNAFLQHIPIKSNSNYPISITFDEFDQEDIDDLGYALVDNDNCQIFLNLNEKWTKDKFNLTLYHEIGHCYGLEHDDSAAIMEAEYTNPKEELKSLPIFWKNIKHSHRKLLIMDSGISLVDNSVNQIIDWAIPDSKDSLKRVINHKNSQIKYKHNSELKIIYQEN